MSRRLRLRPAEALTTPIYLTRFAPQLQYNVHLSGFGVEVHIDDPNNVDIKIGTPLQNVDFLHRPLHILGSEPRIFMEYLNSNVNASGAFSLVDFPERPPTQILPKRITHAAEVQQIILPE